MSRDYCNAKYRREQCGRLDSANANQFKLFDDFAGGVTIRDFSSIRVGGGCDNRAPDITIPRSRDADDSGVDMENGNPLDDVVVSNDNDMLENEVMVDPWSSMESSNSPLTDSAPSGGSAGSTPSPSGARAPPTAAGAAVRPRDLPLALPPRRRHFLEDESLPQPSNADPCRIPEPHFLDHSPSPSPDPDPDPDRRSDLTDPNFLDDDALDIRDDSLQATAPAGAGAIPKRPGRPPDAPRAPYRTHLHYGLGAPQLYRGTWPGDGWPGDTASVRSFSSAGSARAPAPADIDTKIECVYSLLSLLSLSPDNNADLSGPLLEMSRSPESCGAMRQSGCIPLLVQLVHSTQPRETRNRAAQALRNIIHAQTDDKAGRREARVWRLLEQVREYCYILEDALEAPASEKDMSEHPSQCVAALMKLSFDEEHRHVVCQLGGLQALARLVSADQAAHGSRAEDGACVTMRKYAGMTLTNLTFGDGNNKSLLCSFKEFMMALVEQLQSPNDDMRQVTSAVLRNLSWRADTNSKQVLREVGAVKGLTRAAMTCQKEATLKSVLSALWNLTAHCSLNKVALCSVDGALGFLVDMLTYNSPTKTLAIVENAGGIMRNVSSHIAIREDYRQILRERNCLSVLLQHLKSPSLTVVSNSCGTLWNLSARCPHDQQFLWDQGAVPMLRSLIHSKHKMIAMGSSAALKNLLNSKPGKNHIISLDSTARSMNLPVLPTLGVRKQKALEQELDQNLAETCDNIEPANSPSTTNRDEKNLFSATERQLAMNLERHRMTSSSPLMGALGSQNSLSHSAHLAGYLSCSNTLLKGTLVSRSVTGSTSSEVNRSDSRDSVTSTHSDTVLERTRTAKVPIPTPRSKDVVKTEDHSIEKSKFINPHKKSNNYLPYPAQPPVPPPRSGTDVRNNFTESGYDVDHDSCDQPIDFSMKYSEAKSNEPPSGQLLEATTIKPTNKGPREKKKYPEKDATEKYGDYQETDLDQPTDYSLRYAEHQSETSSEISEPPGPSIHEDTIQHFCTEGTPYETPVIFSTATSISDLRVIGGKEHKNKVAAMVKPNPEVMTQSDEKDTCSIEEPPRHDNDVIKPTNPPAKSEKSQFDTKFSSGMISPEKPVNYCEEGTPGCFSRVSSLSSLGDLAEETSLAKKNAMATINIDMDLIDKDLSSSAKDKDGSKAVTFACTPEPCAATTTGGTSPPPQRFVEDTPLVFSRCSSPSSLSGCSVAGPLDEQGSVISEISRLTSGCISPSEIPDSPGQSIPQSPRAPRPRFDQMPPTPPGGACTDAGARSVFEERVASFRVEHTPAHFSTATSLSSLTIDDDPPTAAPHRTVSERAASPQGGQGSRAAGGGTTDGAAFRRSERGVAREEQSPSSIHGHRPADAPDKMSPPVAVVLGTVRDVSDTKNVSSEGGVPPAAAAAAHDTSSDSSNLSDTGEHLLHECIQRGIAGVVKNGNHGAEVTSPAEQYLPRDQLYRSLPPYLRGSTETVRAAAARSLSPERRTERPVSSDESPPPPLPPRPAAAARAPPPPPPPPRPTAPALSPPLSLGSDDERIFNQAVQRGIHQLKERKHESRLPVRSSTRDKTRAATSNLTRTDSLSSLSIDSFGSTDREIFEECIQAGLAKVKKFPLPASEHKAHSAERTGPRRATRAPRSLDRVAPRSDSPDSLSGDSFGSTDKEVFERCVRLGMEGEPAAERPRPRRRRADAGALDRMTGEEDSRDRALLEEMIARGAGELRPPPKNVPAPSAARAPADGSDAVPARTPPRRRSPTTPPRDGSDSADAEEVLAGFDATIESCEMDRSNELPTIDSCNTTLESALSVDMDRSNEYPAVLSANTTLESEARDLLDRSNESYADVLDGAAWSDIGSPPVQYDSATLTRSKNKPAKHIPNELAQENQEESTKRGPDTWNDNTCPDDITFPTISGSVAMVASFKSDAADASSALPDLLEETIPSKLSFPGPDLTDQLEDDRRALLTPPDEHQQNCTSNEHDFRNDSSKFESMTSSAMIEREAAELTARLKNGFYFPAMESSAHSFDLDSVKPPSNMGSLVSLSVSTNMDEIPKKGKPKNRKKSLPVALMVKRALTNSMTYHSSSEHLDSCPASILDNVKPPSELEHMDMESSIISVSSIVSEVAEHRATIPVVFDFDQPISGFSLLNNLNNPINDLDHVNPPSLFDEMMESTLELEQTTAQEVIDDGVSNTLNILTDFGSGSENCSPLPSDVSSVETTPKRARNEKYLTPKEKRQLSKERYNTYTIADEGIEPTDVTIAVEDDCGSDLTLESDSRSEDYVTAQSDHRSRRKISAKQRRQEDRARYQTQTVNIGSIFSDVENKKSPDPQIEDLRRRLAAKKSIRQRRLEDAERFRTRTIEDVPPSPTYVTSDANFENVETTTGYDSLSSAELNHQQLADEGVKESDGNSTDVQADSGTNDDDFELNTTQMQTYTRSFRNYLPVIESPTAVDICVVNNLKNIELTASFRRTPTYSLDAMRAEPPCDASADRDSDANSDSEPDNPPVRAKPKIVKPTVRRDDSLDSNGSCDEPTVPKAIRGRRKPAYISPYKRNVPRKSPNRTVAIKSAPVSKPQSVLKPFNEKSISVPKTKPSPKSTTTSRIPNNMSPKKTTAPVPPKPSTSQKTPSQAVKPLPIERQGTFTKEESTVLPKESTSPNKKPMFTSRLAKATTSPKPNLNTSPSRLPQPKSVAQKPQLRKTLSHEVKPTAKRPTTAANRASFPAMKNSPSNQSLQSNESTKTVTLASHGSRHGSASSVNSPPTKASKDVASRIANLWKKVEQSKRAPSRPDRRVWIGGADAPAPSDPPKLLRSSTFEGQPKEAAAVSATPKTKSSIAIRVSQIPSGRFAGRAGPSRPGEKAPATATAARRAPATKVFARKQLNGQEIAT